VCDFISWVEAPSEDGGRHIFFLTDREIFSKRGRSLFGQDPFLQGNDLLGHGAIRSYYSLKETGKDHEIKTFWNPDAELPEEIRELAPWDPKQFDQHWGRLWDGGAFQPDDLTRIIVSDAPEIWCRRALKQLLSRPDLPIRYSADVVERCHHDHLTEQAFVPLMQHPDLTAEHLKRVGIRCRHLDSADYALAKLLAHPDLTTEHLWHVTQSCRHELLARPFLTALLQRSDCGSMHLSNIALFSPHPGVVAIAQQELDCLSK